MTPSEPPYDLKLGIGWLVRRVALASHHIIMWQVAKNLYLFVDQPLWWNWRCTKFFRRPRMGPNMGLNLDPACGPTWALHGAQSGPCLAWAKGPRVQMGPGPAAAGRGGAGWVVLLHLQFHRRGWSTKRYIICCHLPHAHTAHLTMHQCCKWTS